MSRFLGPPDAIRQMTGPVYCPLCTRVVNALILVGRRASMVKPGQKCARCGSSLDAAAVMVSRAA